MKPRVAPLLSVCFALGAALHPGLTRPASASLAAPLERVDRSDAWMTLTEAPAALSSRGAEASRTRDLGALELRSPGLAVGLSLAAPLAVTSLGSGLMLLGGYPSTPYSLWSVAGAAIWLTSPLALGVGQAYGGDAGRGFRVGLGTYGAIVGGTLLGLGVAYAMNPQTLASGGQSAGLAYALIALPIQAVVTLGYTIWALVDAYQSTERQNETKAAQQP